MPISPRTAAFLLASTLAPLAQAQFTGSIITGGVEFDLALQAPFPNMGPALLRPSNFVSTLEPDRSQLNQFLWFYHIAGDPRAYNFNTELGQQVQTTPDSLIVTQNSTGWNGVQTYQLTSTGPATGALHSTARVDNLGTAPLTISLYHYADLDDNGTFTDDTAALTGPGAVTVTDPVGPFSLSFVADQTPNAFQASPWRSLLDALCNSNLTQLNNTGLPFGPGDFTMAWQWDFVVPAGGSVTVGDTITIVPAPAALPALLLLLAGRRRRARVPLAPSGRLRLLIHRGAWSAS